MSIVSFVIYFQIYVEIRIRMRITVTTKLRDSDSDFFLGLFSPSQILPKLLLHVLSLPKLKSHADCCMAFFNTSNYEETLVQDQNVSSY